MPHASPCTHANKETLFIESGKTPFHDKMETITDVDLCVFPAPDNAGVYDYYIGVRIVAGDATVQVAISDYQLCCEAYGVNIYVGDMLTTIDTLRETLVGCTLTSVAWYDTYRHTDPFHESFGVNDMHTAPVRIVASGHVVHIVPWNEHNGYYSHTARVAWQGYADTQTI
jgi:hypothetical protein